MTTDMFPIVETIILSTIFLGDPRLRACSHRVVGVAPVLHYRWSGATALWGNSKTRENPRGEVGGPLTKFSDGEEGWKELADRDRGRAQISRFPGIAAFTSNRTNLSPFTKGCRDRGAIMRKFNFWRRQLR